MDPEIWALIAAGVAGQIDTAVSVTGSLSVAKELSGQSDVSVSLSGGLTVVTSVAGQSDIVITTGGDLSVVRGLSGQIDVVKWLWENRVFYRYNRFDWGSQSFEGHLP